MPQIPFFALKDDLVTLLEAVEQNGELKYVRMGSFDEPTPDVFSRGVDLPSLGKATTESAATCEGFLVCAPHEPLVLRPVTQRAGSTKYYVDQLENPDTITFTPGGLWTKEVLLSGRVATVSADFSQQSKRLLNRFRSVIENHFVRVRAYRVGPSALDFLKAGKRLTIAEQSPRDADLTLN